MTDIKKEMKMKLEKRIKQIYIRRQKAHDELLACDLELDNVFKALASKEKIKE